jgi:hypothetical protein
MEVQAAVAINLKAELASFRMFGAKRSATVRTDLRA